MKVFFELTGDYSGLRVRRVARFGRIYFEKVINDGDPYWLFAVRPFDATTEKAQAVCLTAWADQIIEDSRTLDVHDVDLSD